MMWIKSFLISIGVLSAPVAPPPPLPVEVDCFKTCAVSDQGYEMVRAFEGYMPFPYKDIAGIQTVGYGYVLQPGDKFIYPLLPMDADALLKKTMGRYERDINRSVIIRLQQNQFDAMASLTYNIGAEAFRGSTLLRRANASRHTEVPACFLMWNKARIRGVLQPVEGLTLRRQQEADLYAGI